MRRVNWPMSLCSWIAKTGCAHSRHTNLLQRISKEQTFLRGARQCQSESPGGSASLLCPYDPHPEWETITNTTDEDSTSRCNPRRVSVTILDPETTRKEFMKPYNELLGSRLRCLL